MDQTTMAESAAERPGLTTQDLSLVLQIIQLASARGAVKAEELSAVGGVYDRINRFLNAAATPTPNGPVEGKGEENNRPSIIPLSQKTGVVDSADA